MMKLDDIDNSERIIVALDTDGMRARELSSILQGHAKWLKVGMTLYYAEGPQIVREFKDMGYKVFLDLKFFDIPHQVEGAAYSAVCAGADMLTMHACGGAQMMQAAAAGIARGAAEVGSDPISLAVTVLTSMDENDLEDLGITRPLHKQVMTLAAMAQKAGIGGVVASPEEAADLRAALGPDAAIVTPGIRPAGAGKDDQARISTPASAIRAGASHIVVGRPISQAADPLAAFDAIAALS
jgi:orotidine-5'-phosphate decarboxylase